MQQPINKDNELFCPLCGGELAGDGENFLECMHCDYTISESQIEELPIPKALHILESLEAKVTIDYEGLTRDEVLAIINKAL